MLADWNGLKLEVVDMDGQRIDRDSGDAQGRDSNTHSEG